jgi:hypothetical protein
VTTEATKSRKQQLMEKIEDAHDMQQQGQAWQWEACGVHITERCDICGLTHEKYRNGQNSPDSDTWRDSKGNDLTLAEAARKDCD